MSKRYILNEDFDLPVAIMDTIPADVLLDTPDDVREIELGGVEDNAYLTLINSLISQKWSLIDQFNAAKATFEAERPEDEKSILILSQIITQDTTHIGMLLEATGQFDNNETNEFIEKGKEEGKELGAEIISADEE